MMSSKDIKKYLDMSHEERQLRYRISIAKAHFNSVEVIARHRMELGVWDSKKYRKTVNDAEKEMEKTLDRLQQELDEKFG